MPDVRVSMIVNNKEVKAADVRLAVNRVDYFVPLDLSGYTGKNVLLKFKLGSETTLCRANFLLLLQRWGLADASIPAARKVPSHLSLLLFTVWMNDPNGKVVCKDGEYHLFYQYNPYGSNGKYELGTCYQQDLT